MFGSLSEYLDDNNAKSSQYFHRIDAGVMFADQESYLCFPLARFNIASEKLVQNIESSCECVRPSLVRYSGPTDQMTDGLRIDFVREPTGQSFASPNLLAVELRLSLADGSDCMITVDFLQTELSNGT